MKKHIALLMAAVLMCGCSAAPDESADISIDTIETGEQSADPSETVTESEVTSEVTAEPAATSEPAVTVEAEVPLKTFSLDDVITYDFLYANVDAAEGADFLTAEQMAAFRQAYYVVYCLELDSGTFHQGIGSEYDEAKLVPDTYHFRTGYSYDSVMSEFCSVLSEEYLTSRSDVFGGYDGEFAMGIGARGGNIFYLGELRFEPIEVTEEMVSFKLLAKYGDPDNPDDFAYEENLFAMEKQGENWVFTQFSLWL